MSPIQERPRAPWPETGIATSYGSHNVWIESGRRVRVWGRFQLPTCIIEGTIVLCDGGSGFKVASDKCAVEFFDEKGKPYHLSRATRDAISGSASAAIQALRQERGELFGQAEKAAQSNRLRDIEVKLKSDWERVRVLLDAWREQISLVDEKRECEHAIGKLVLELLMLAEHHSRAAFPCLRAHGATCAAGEAPCLHCRVVGRIARAQLETRVLLFKDSAP